MPSCRTILFSAIVLLLSASVAYYLCSGTGYWVSGTGENGPVFVFPPAQSLLDAKQDRLWLNDFHIDWQSSTLPNKSFPIKEVWSQDAYEEHYFLGWMPIRRKCEKVYVVLLMAKLETVCYFFHCDSAQSAAGVEIKIIDHFANAGEVDYCTLKDVPSQLRLSVYEYSLNTAALSEVS